MSCWIVSRETFPCCSCGHPARLLLVKEAGREAWFEGDCPSDCPGALVMHSATCGHETSATDILGLTLAGFQPAPSEHDETCGRPNYCDREGLPMSFPAWVLISQGAPEYKRVALDRAGNTEISTIWLGLDHGWPGPIRIFETMVFGAGDEIDMVRYATEAEAIAGHREKVAEYRALARRRPTTASRRSRRDL